MTDPELYQLLIEGEYPGVLEIIHEEREGGRGQNQMGTQALALALSGQVEEAEWIVQSLSSRESTPEEKAILVEAELVLAIRRGLNKEKIAELAQQAVNLSSGTVIAHRVLGDLAERARRAEVALRHYEAAFRASPENDRSRRDLARILAHVRRRREALDLVGRMEPSLQREIYRLAILLRGPMGVPVSAIVAFLILATPTFHIALWSTLAVGSMLTAFSLRWRDGLVFAAGIRVVILAIGALLLREFLGMVVSG
ncbi:MAG: hypothetical protein AB1449_08245 [Chloroflexota bacterium]